MSKYGISTVVGGFQEQLSAEELIPYTLHRTYIEHRQLRQILRHTETELHDSIEIGCGYGRNILLLAEFSRSVTGVERDKELFNIANTLNPGCYLYNGLFWEMPKRPYTLYFTFTFLQHLTDVEVFRILQQINDEAPLGAYVLLTEETDLEKSTEGCWSRSVEQYSEMLPSFSWIRQWPRVVENQRPSGTHMLFGKI